MSEQEISDRIVELMVTEGLNWSRAHREAHREAVTAQAAAWHASPAAQ
ncbi:hypothetical protein [Micromonospora sp. RTGN7]|nr:hypothetical protein [Micromonospora sp. RTGN7]